MTAFAAAGTRQCNAVGPDVYELGERGYCAVAELVVPDGLAEQALAGADACPEQAITVI